VDNVANKQRQKILTILFSLPKHHTPTRSITRAPLETSRDAPSIDDSALFSLRFPPQKAFVFHMFPFVVLLFLSFLLSVVGFSHPSPGVRAHSLKIPRRRVDGANCLSFAPSSIC